MRARIWLNITGYQGNLTHLVNSYEKIYEGANLQFGNWWYDQIITTHSLLASKIGQGCTGCNAWSDKSYKVRNIFRIIRFKPILMSLTQTCKKIILFGKQNFI